MKIIDISFPLSYVKVNEVQISTYISVIHVAPKLYSKIWYFMFIDKADTLEEYISNYFKKFCIIGDVR